jgi:hypothetical protein
MNKVLLSRAVGITGTLLILCGYWLLWISPDAELEEVILRTRISIVMNLSGAVFVVYYLFKKSS